jgi:hypothetical protein
MANLVDARSIVDRHRRLATEGGDQSAREPSMIVVHDHDRIRLRAGLDAVDIAERQSRYVDDYQGCESQHEQRRAITPKKAKFVPKYDPRRAQHQESALDFVRHATKGMTGQRDKGIGQIWPMQREFHVLAAGVVRPLQ